MRLGHLIVGSILLSGTVFGNVSSTGPGYTAGSISNVVYSVDLQTGATASVVTIPGAGPIDLALLNKNTAYVLGLGTRNVYEVNLQNNTYRNITPTPIPAGGSPIAIALANATTAYVVSTNNTIYSVNLQSGALFSVATISGSPGLSDIAMLNSNTAYVVGGSNDKVYLVNLQTGASSVVATLSGSPHLEGIALATSKTAYVVGASDGTIREVDLQTGASSIVTTISTVPPAGSASLGYLAINNTTAYSADSENSTFYSINLSNGLYSILSTVTEAQLNGAAILLQMPTNGLSGNNLNLANYLNVNGPIDAIREFALLPGGLSQALESAAPTRNAFLTYASQNGYLAASQALADHGRQARFRRGNNAIALLADASDNVKRPRKWFWNSSKKQDPDSSCQEKQEVQVEPPCERKPYTIWFTPFGEYAREKEQSQTPAFSMGLGGAVAAFEWSSEQNNVFGCGIAYVYTHVHEEEGAGQANLNQGFITLYSTLNARNWYFDLGLWGGYYHSNNQRKISFPGVQVTANSHAHGWQMAPHLEVGYDGFWMKNGAVDWFGIEPFVMAEWVANWEHGFQEHGAGNLNMGQEGRFCSLLRGESGLRFHEIVSFNWGKLIFQEKGSYAYQKAFQTGHLTAFLVGSPGTFSVTTLNSAQNLGVGELSILFSPKSAKAPCVALRYQGEFGSQYQSHQGMLEISQSF